MKIFVQAKPNAKEEKIEPIETSEEGKNVFRFKISIKEPPIQGKVNLAIIKLLADYFKVSPQNIRIVSGFSSRRKIIEIN